MQTFRADASGADAGTTVSVDRLHRLDVTGAVLSTRDVIRAGNPDWGDQRVEAEFRRSQVDSGGFDWYAPRNAFERHWQHGKRFVYLALVGPGPGLAGLAEPRYGDFTIILDPLDPEPDALAVFPDNTAERYALTGSLDVAACEGDIAAWSDRGDLLTVKHSTQVMADPAKPWGEVVCTERSFSEVVRAGYLPVSKVTEVRMVADFRQRALDAFLAPDPDALTSMQSVLAAGMRTLIGWQRHYGVSIVAT